MVSGVVVASGEWPCAVCKNDVGRNSEQGMIGWWGKRKSVSERWV